MKENSNDSQIKDNKINNESTIKEEIISTKENTNSAKEEKNESNEENNSKINDESEPLLDSSKKENTNNDNNIVQNEENNDNDNNDEKEENESEILTKEKKQNTERISLEKLLKIKLSFSPDASRGRTGLTNIGNTCFMNSALQCLSNCPELTKYFLLDFYEDDINPDNKLGTGGQVVQIYRKLLEDLWNGEYEYINPSYFKRIFAHFVHKFSGYAQQDSNEFLIYLLDKIHEDLNTITVKPYIEMDEKKNDETDEEVSKKWWEKHLKRENSIIVDLYHGQFKSTISCNYCNRVCVSFDSYMFLSLPIPSGKYEIDIKYFGYDINNFLIIKIPITENTTVLNIIDIISNKITHMLKNKNNNEKNNPPRKKNRKNRNKNKINIIKKKNEEISFGKNKIEMVLLNNNKKIHKVFISNDYVFSYLKQGYELVAYEKDNTNNRNENIYFYLSKYYHNYLLSLFYYPRIYLFNYPFAINIDKSQNISSIHKNIKEFLKKFILNTDTNKKDEILNVNFIFDKINRENEKNCGFTIYLNIYLPNNNICGSLFGYNNYINYPILEKHSSGENIANIKKQLILNDAQRITLDINILFNLDESKLPNLNITYKKISLKTEKDINIYDCLNLFNSEEILDGDNEWYCNICKKHRDAIKKMDIYKSPFYLIIQLKRFKQDDEERSIFNIFNSSKNTAFVNFPTKDLDLSKYILSESNIGDKYDLIGVINHYGGESFGHYTAYCLNGGKWFEYNDDSVTYIKEDNVVSSQAYVLFYKRKNN